MNNLNTFLPKSLPPAPPSNRLRLRIKPIGVMSRLLSLALILWLAIGQPGAVLRLLAQEMPLPDQPTLSVPEQISRPFVGTDQADYPPGATAYISGKDFQAGETVWLQVLHADGTPNSGDEHEPWAVLAGSDGAFQSTWHVCEDDCLGATLLLTATGESSALVAQMQFTDGTPSGTSPIPGSLYAMGWNSYGQLGTGDRANRSTPTPVLSLPDGRKVVAVAGGESASLAQANDGSLWAWGNGNYGQIGNGSFATTYSPVQVNALLGGRTAAQIAAGALHNLVVANDGSLWAWGLGGSGQLGHGRTDSRVSPVQVNALPEGRTAVQIAGGREHSLALASDGTVWAWGNGYYGQLGYGGNGNVYSPNRVNLSPLGGRTVIAIASGYYHSVALAGDGTVWAWGHGFNGELGNGSGGLAYTPIQVTPVWGAGRMPVSIATGIGHTIALMNDGTIWAWGDNYYGQIGNGTTADAYYPTAVNLSPLGSQTIKTIAAGGFHNYVLATDGSLWGWGNAQNGELGNGSFSPPVFTSPIRVNPLPAGKTILRIAGGSSANGFILAGDANQFPVAVNDSYGTPEDGVLTVPASGVLANDSDPDGDALTVTSASTPAYGTLSMNADGSFTYTPVANYNGPDSFNYTIADGKGGTASASVTITVTAVNDAPMAHAQSVSTSEDTAKPITLTGSDVEGSSLTYNIVVSPAHGTLSGVAPNVTYTPAANYNGPDSFTFKANDGTVDSAAATVSINVTAVNDGPEAVKDSYNLGEDMILSLASAANGVLANDSDVDANTLTAVLVSSASHGTLTLQPDGRFTYTPVANFNGPDSFTYRVNDGVVDSAIATVTINVIPVNDGPQLANPGNKMVNELDSLAFTLSATDVDLPTDTLTYSIASGGESGMTLDGSSGAFAWTPTEAQGPGVYTVTFRVTDLAGLMSAQTITITVSEVNVVPTITDVPAEDTIAELVNFTFDASGSDPDAPVQSLTYSLMGAPAGATIDATTGVFSWTPAENQGPSDYTFAIRISDGVTTADAPILLHVTEVNVAPVANGQTVMTAEDTALGITLAGSDADLPVNILSFSVVSGPAHGTLSGTIPSLTYTPAANYNGPDSFTFMVNDGALDSAVVTVSITVTAVNDGPLLAAPGDKLVNELEPLAFTLSATDVDLPTDTLTYSIASGGEFGMVLDAGTGAFTWTPTEAQGPGVYTVTFQVTDAAGVMSEQTITITVSEVNVVPTITDVPAEDTIPELVNFTFDASGSDPDAPVQSLTFSLIGAPTGATIDATTGLFNWTPTEDQGAGDYPFAVRISDGVTTADSLIVLHVTEVNVAPVLTSPGNQAIDEQATLAFALAATDADLPANPLSYSIASGAQTGMTLDAGTGAFAWTPTEAQGPGSYTVTFRVTDGGGLMSEQTITITVNEVNAAPVANAQSVTTPEDMAAVVTLTGSDVDLPANLLTYLVTTGPLHGTLSGTAPNLTYTPAANYHGSDSFTFEVSDGTITVTAVIGITVTPVNDTPTADSQAVALNEDTVANLTLTGSDLDGDALSFSIVTPPAHGVLSGVVPNLVYTPAANYFGPDSFTFKVNDNTVDSAIATVSIMVNPVNDAPVAQADSITINEDSGANAINVLANDSFAPDAPETLVVIGVTPGAYGTVTFTAAGVSYAPAPDFYGSDSFTYTISDGNGGSATTTVTVTVLNVNDAPVLTLAAASPLPINENDVVSLAGSLTDADPLDAHVVTIAWADGSANTVLNLAAGVLTFSTSHRYLDDGPTATASDVKTISVSLADNNGGSAAANQTVTVNNVAPVITSITGPVGPLAKGTSASVTVNFSDVGTLDSHTVRFVWDDGTPDTVQATGGFARTAAHTYAAPGVYSVGVTVTDDDTGVATTTFEYIVVYDPSAGFVTGGGWVNSPAGAYVADATLTGKASFGFVSKYQKGTTIPTGETEFQFHAAGFKFQSTIYEWLVVSGPLAQYKGSGTINGTGDYGFLLTATDGQVSGGGGVDKFRIKIWEKISGAVVYDNAMGASDDINSANPQVIGGGSIVVHKAR